MNDKLKRTANTTKALAGRTYDYTYSCGMKVHLEIAEGIYLVQWFEPEIKATSTLVINDIAGSISSREAYSCERAFDTAIIH